MSGDGNDAGTAPTKRAYTAPKGRPTRARRGGVMRKRAFGPVAQWIVVTVAAIVVVVIVILVTEGGDFNPLNDDPLGAPAEATSPTVT